MSSHWLCRLTHPPLHTKKREKGPSRKPAGASASMYKNTRPFAEENTDWFHKDSPVDTNSDAVLFGLARAWKAHLPSQRDRAGAPLQPDWIY